MSEHSVHVPNEARCFECRVSLLEGQRDELMEAVQSLIPLGSNGDVCKGCWTCAPRPHDDDCEVNNARALLERIETEKREAGR